MKANETLDKLYFNQHTAKYNHERRNDDDIEYTRTDAFIEKACDAYCKVCGHFAHSVPTHICRHDCKYFSDFKNYIKGE